MSDSPPTPPELPTRRASFRQVSLRTLFLLTAAVAVWVAHGNNLRQTTDLAVQVAAMRPLARELNVDDPAQFAVVKQEEQWYDENRWQLHLPPGNFRLCIATREVSEQGLAPVTKAVPLSSGKHTLEIKQQRHADKSWSVVVTADEVETLRVDEPAEWDPAHGSSGGGQYSHSTQQVVTQPLILFRRRFTVETKPGSYSTPPGPHNGILLWIEAEGD